MPSISTGEQVKMGAVALAWYGLVRCALWSVQSEVVRAQAVSTRISLLLLPHFAACSLNAFVVVFARGLDLAPGGCKKREEAVTLRELQKRVSGNAQDFDEVIKRAKRHSSSTGAAPGSVPSSKRASAHNSGPVPSTPGAGGARLSSVTVHDQASCLITPLPPPEGIPLLLPAPRNSNPRKLSCL